MIPTYNRKDELLSLRDRNPLQAKVRLLFPKEDTTMPYSGFEPEPTRLQAEEQVWDQLKRQMPSCHSVHDLELAVQDLWAHLPRDNIRCLINSMPDRVVACITAGGGPTRY
ncbi:transposable element Tcb2 transposase [Trichonephila clavipes]|nr:transposable element Tcb2 transposase [Trichonephila clavipes]